MLTKGVLNTYPSSNEVPETTDPKQPCNSFRHGFYLTFVTKLIGAGARDSCVKSVSREPPRRKLRADQPGKASAWSGNQRPYCTSIKKMRAQSIRPGPHSIISTLITLHFQHVSSLGTYRQAGYQLLYIRLLPRYEDHVLECLGCMIRIRLY